jgi:uncharacterized SAM-binding protein YcdF (DUF218 family)
VLILVLAFLWLVASSAGFLIVDHPEKSDAILVLAGETEQRPARALELLNEGYATRAVFDVPADPKVYGTTYLQLAQDWAKAQPSASALVICPTHGLSTKAETLDAAECLRKLGVRSVLVVTSDFHTRRALSIFRRQDPEWTFSVAAAYDATQFGVQWWRHRQWAKTNVDEWLRMFWWELVDRWER